MGAESEIGSDRPTQPTEIPSLVAESFNAIPRRRLPGRFRLSSASRSLLERKRPLTVSAVTFAVAILLLSSFAGLARGQGPGPVILLRGLAPVTVSVGQSRNLSLNITGGYVDASHPYTVTWFEGKSNSTSVQAIAQHVIPNPSCTYYQNNCTYTTNTKLAVGYAWPGSYVVSVTVNDSRNDYSIGTDRVTVTDSVSLTCIADSGPQNNNAVWVGVPILFSAYAAPGSGVTYLWDFGDGTKATGSWMQEGGTNGVDCRERVGYYYGVYGVRHTYSDPGNYVVKVTAYNSFGAADRAYLAPLALGDPQPALDNWSIPAKGYKLSPTLFWANATDMNPLDLASNTTFAWNFSDGTPWQISHVTSVCTSTRCGSGIATTETSHTFKTNGNYTVWVEVFNQYGNVTPNPTQPAGPTSAKATISIQNPKSGPCFGGASPVTGVVIIPISGCWGISPWSTAYNATWLGPAGKSYGLAGDLRSYSYGNQSVPVYLNQTSGPAYGQTPAVATFTDVTPIVGSTSLTTTPTITLSTGGTLGPCIFSQIVASLFNGSGIIAQATLPCGSTSVTLPTRTLFLGNSYSIQTQYFPIGGAGTTTAKLKYVFQGNTTGNRQYTWVFNNANPGTYLWTQDVSQVSLGEPVTVSTTAFSFADVSLTTKWTFGDGTWTQTTSPAPGQRGPSLVVTNVTHTWRTGANYNLLIQTTDPVLGGQGGLTGQDAIRVIEVVDLSVNDTAARATITAPAVAAEAGATSFSTTLYQADGGAGTTSVRWYFGDGTTASGSSAVHNYSGAGTYAVVAVATSARGSASAVLDMLRVSPAPVVPALNCTPTAPRTFVLISCSVANSSIGSDGLALAGIGWDFGDGTSSGGPTSLDAVVQHVYTASGTDTVNVTVQSSDGIVSSTILHLVVCPVGLSISLSLLGDTADERHVSVATPSGCPAFYGSLIGVGYFENISWNWGGGWPSGSGYVASANKYGVVEGNTYVVPGTYTQNATIKNVLNGTQTTQSQRVTVVDYPVSVALPYNGATIYGENHSVSFTGKALGGYYDCWGSPGCEVYSGHNLTNKWNYTWAWGDGSGSLLKKVQTNQSTLSHWYNTTGAESLSLTVGSPEPTAYRSGGMTIAQLNTLLDTDGDGLPNAYEAAITNTSAWYADTADKTGAFGVGLTDFQAGMLNGLLSNLTADQDGDGLTSLQEILGSVTGFPSNPLDANTAGDGIPDGGHFFTDSFRASSVVNLPAGAHITNVTIPNAGYRGAPNAFNQSKLVVQFTTGSLSSIRLNLVMADGTNVSLPTPANYTNTFYLLNQSPIAGPTGNLHGNLLLWVSDWSVVGNWTLEVNTTSTFTGGSVPSAYVQDSYYTNPNVADPYHQGMLEGSTVTVPLFNCSSPSNETFPVFNATRLTVTQQAYWPYTEQYYKLSVVQGVPYAPGVNSSSTPFNNASTCGSGVSSSHYHDVATYFGDADFGISPWNVHAAGDSALTNGMKALGAAHYNATEWHYENTLGQMIGLGGTNPYPADTIRYAGTLNPTALSSSGDGLSDSAAANPVAPLVLGVTVNYAVDPACITSPFLGPFVDIVGVSLVGQFGPTAYTPGVDGSGGASNSGCWSPYSQNMQFSFYDSYTLPINNTLSGFKVLLSLYHDDALGYQTDANVTLSGSLSLGHVVWASSPYFNASAQVLAMSRVNTILSNTTEELASFSGYGLRYTGEQEFYAFYVNLGSSAPAPFVSGVNLILESRKAYLASPASAILANASTQFNGSTLSCLGNAEVTDRTANSTPSETGVAGTFSIDLSSNPSCATTLLMELSARNATGVVVGQNRTLNSTQIDLLGIGSQSAQLAAYQPPTGFNSNLGAPPNGFLNSALETAWNYFVGGLVALGNFITAVAKDVVTLGQLILGAIARALGAIASAAAAAVAAIQALANFIVALASSLMSALLSPVKAAVLSWGNGVAGAYRTLWTAINSSANSTVLGKDAVGLLTTIFGGPFALALALGTATLVIIALVTGFTLGGGFLVGLIVSLVLTAITAALSYAGYTYTSFMTIPALQAADGVFNASKSLAPSAPPGGSTCSGYGVTATDIGAAAGLLSAAFAEDDIVQIYDTVLFFGNTPGQSWSLFVQPIAELAMGILATLMLALIHNGLLPSYLGQVPLWLAGGGILGSVITLIQAKKYGGSLTSPSPFVRLTEIALGVNALAMGVGVYDLASPC